MFIKKTIINFIIFKSYFKSKNHLIQSRFSTIIVVAPPPPLQIPAIPNLPLFCFKTLINEITILAPLTLFYFNFSKNKYFY